MSLSIIRKNTGSPFHLQRSIVSQEDGAYTQGGYNPDAVYDDSGMTAGIASVGKAIGGALSSITEGDKNKMNEKKKARLEKRQGKIIEKMNVDSNTDKRQTSLNNRFNRIEKRKERVEDKIDSYNEKQRLLGHSTYSSLDEED
jgi:hypothetical protein